MRFPAASGLMWPVKDSLFFTLADIHGGSTCMLQPDRIERRGSLGLCLLTMILTRKGECNDEGKSIRQADVREVQGCKAQRRDQDYLRESEA